MAALADGGVTTQSERGGVEHEADAADGYIYMVGGRQRGRTLMNCERLSLGRGAWEKAPLLLENRGSLGGAGLGNTVYAIGGGGVSHGEVYTCPGTSAERLVVEADVPSAGDGGGDGDGGAAADADAGADVDVNDDINTEGSGSGGNAAVAGGSWSYVASMATPRHALAVVAMPETNSLYAIGGWINPHCTASVERYDASEDKWVECASLNTARRLHSAAVCAGKIYVFGGSTAKTHDIRSTEVYDPATDAWSPSADLPFGAATAAATVGDQVYVALFARSMLRYDPETDSFETLSKLPLPEWHCFSMVSGGPGSRYAYLIGGATQGAWTGACLRYDTHTDTYEDLAPMPTERRRSAAVLVRAESSKGDEDGKAGDQKRLKKAENI